MKRSSEARGTGPPRGPDGKQLTPAAAAARVRRGGGLAGIRAGRGGLEEHRDEAGLDGGVVARLLEPGRAALVDRRHLLVEPRARRRDLAEALRVERHRLPAEVRLLVVEAARRGRRPGGVDRLLEGGRDHRSLDHSRHLRPRAIGHLRASARLVVVLHRAAPRAPLDELHEPEIRERPHVVAHVPERRVELCGEVAGRGDPVLEGAEDLNPQPVRECLDEARIPNVADRSHLLPHCTSPTHTTGLYLSPRPDARAPAEWASSIPRSGGYTKRRAYEAAQAPARSSSPTSSSESSSASPFMLSSR